MTLHRHDSRACPICTRNGLTEHAHADAYDEARAAMLDIESEGWYGGAPLPDGHVVSGRIEPGDPFNMGVVPAPQHPASATEPARHDVLGVAVGIGSVGWVIVAAIVILAMIGVLK